jgi:hypothetical protein
MALTIELAPEQEQVLREEANRRGVPVEDYAKALLEGSLPAQANGATQGEDRNDAEFESTLDAFSEGTEHLPILPSEADSREWIYGDHD